jgi:hypothetical protein
LSSKRGREQSLPFIYPNRIKGEKMVKKAALLILLFSVLALGCTSLQESKIAGRWACKKTGDTMQLLEDHTCMIYSVGHHYQGRWSVSRSNITIEAGPIVLKGVYDDKKIEAEETVMHGKFTFEKVETTG